MPGTPAVATDRVLTVPNLISFARLLGVPLFLYLFLGRRTTTWPRWSCSRSAAPPTGSTATWPAGSARSAGSASCSTRSPTGSTSWPRWSRSPSREVVPWQFTVALLARELVLLVCLGGAAPRTATGRRRCTTSARPPRSCCSPRSRCCCSRTPCRRRRRRRPRSAGRWPGGASVLYWLAGVLYVVQIAALVRAPAVRHGGRRRADRRAPDDRRRTGAGQPRQRGVARLPHRAVPQPARPRLRRRRRAARPRRARAGRRRAARSRGSPRSRCWSIGFLLAVAYRQTVADEPRPQPGPRRAWSTRSASARRADRRAAAARPTACATRWPGCATRRWPRRPAARLRDLEARDRAGAGCTGDGVVVTVGRRARRRRPGRPASGEPDLGRVLDRDLQARRQRAVGGRAPRRSRSTASG